MEEPYMAEGLFQGWSAEDKAKVTLYVPAGTKAAYQGTDVWGDFNIVEMEPIYTVVFEDANGNVLKTEKRQKGENATPPDAPNIVGYEFVGWDTDFTNIQSDLTIKAQYQQKSFTVTFVNWDDTELKKETVEYGKDATPPANPTRSGYTFTGWDKSYEIVKSDLTIKAQFKQNDSSGGSSDSGGGSDSGSGDKGGKEDKGDKDDDSKGLNDVQADYAQPTKVLRDGQLLILYNGRMYDIQGKETK
jgi:hypothetical protein